MIELKVQCDCGQRYKFDVEPSNGRMPFTVNCPTCGLDGTEKANALLREQPAAAAAPIIAQPKLRINLAAAGHQPPPLAAPPVPASALQRASPAAMTSAVKPIKEANVPLGVVGAIVGGSIGMVGWYLLIKVTHYEIGYAAWAVGLLAGLGARILGRAGNTTLGVVAAICALAAILGGQYLFAMDAVNKVKSQLGDLTKVIGESAYETRMGIARQAADAQTDEQIKAVYQKMNAVPPTEQELAGFKEKTLPGLKDLASGKITKADFLKDLNEKSGKAMEKVIDKINLSARWDVFKSTIDAFTLLFLVLGVSSAYKIGAG